MTYRLGGSTIAVQPEQHYLPVRRQSAVITLRWMPIQYSEQVKEDLIMRELNRNEIGLISGADGEDDSGGDVNAMCDTLGDASALAASAAIYGYSGLSGPMAAFAAGLAMPAVNSSVDGTCQSISDEMYIYVMYLIDSALDDTWEGMTGENW